MHSCRALGTGRSPAHQRRPAQPSALPVLGSPPRAAKELVVPFVLEKGF